MNKVITINLGGTAFQLEEGGYDALRAYLETGAARLQGNPDRAEILSDIERAIGDKFSARLTSFKNVVETNEVSSVLVELGPIVTDPGDTAGPQANQADDPGGPSAASAPGATREEPATANSRAPRRLYRIYEGAMISGVCNGIAAYSNIDPTLVRLAFVLLTVLWGIGAFVYVVMVIMVPVARSPEEKAAASGPTPTAREFIRRAKEGYYEAMKGFPDRKARREWKHRFRRELREWRHSFARQMRVNADQWRQEWHHHRAECHAFHPAAGFALPLLSLLHSAVTILWISASISVLATNSLFGLPLPATVPAWVAALLLFVTYGIFEWPLKAARRAYYWGRGQPRWGGSFVLLTETAVWLVVVVLLLVLAIHYSPELREAIRSLPSVSHQAVDAVRTWWKGQ